MTLTAASPLAEFVPLFMEAKTLAETSRRDYGRYLRRFDEFTDHKSLRSALTLDNAAHYLVDVRRGGPFAAHNAAMVLKSLATWAKKSRYLTGRGGESVLTGLENPSTPKHSRQPFTDEQVAKIFAAIEDRPSRDRARTRAYFWLLFATGLRKNEARQLALANLHLDEGWIHVLAMTSKGKKERFVRIDHVAAEPIMLYLFERPKYVAPPVDEGNNLIDEPLLLTEDGSPFSYFGFSSWADRVFRYVRDTAGVKGSSHVWRHTWATQYHRASKATGLTLYDLQREGGWADLAIVRRYAHDRPWEEFLSAPTHLTAFAQRKSGAA